jgi:hypothetical protein
VNHKRKEEEYELYLESNSELTRVSTARRASSLPTTTNPSQTNLPNESKASIPNNGKTPALSLFSISFSSLFSR